MDEKITIIIYADTSKFDQALEQLAQRVKSGGHELTDTDGARQAVEETVPKSFFGYPVDSLARQVAELARQHENEKINKLLRDLDPR